MRRPVRRKNQKQKNEGRSRLAAALVCCFSAALCAKALCAAAPIYPNGQAFRARAGGHPAALWQPAACFPSAAARRFEKKPAPRSRYGLPTVGTWPLPAAAVCGQFAARFALRPRPFRLCGRLPSGGCRRAALCAPGLHPACLPDGSSHPLQVKRRGVFLLRARTLLHIPGIQPQI